ncbi:MAG: hypothetical protein LPK46_03625 [Bacteroidota bacterium]|nr:hypothetical protein [Bacteroidota bacterium]MDX5505210.1 hypothetical protein [Bacteroidota bacterium]
MKSTLKFGIFALALAASVTSCKKDDPVDQPVDNSTVFTESTLKDEDGNVVETILTVDDRGEGIGTRTLTKDKTWVLDGFVFVNSGQTLTIEAGTVIKGKSGQGENASALIVARGGKIEANGTATMPIVMTAEADKIRQKADGTGFENGGNLNPTTSGLWGGLIILGNADVTSATTERAIEGIPTSEKRGLYGGNDDNDNSGTVKYVSIRHGGTDIGAGNEINGITLGGVGAGTTIENIEIIANADDGIEFFGGNVNVKYLLVTNAGDDAIDYDEGYKGMVQFAFVYNPGDRGGEHDGGPSDCEDCMPYATPVFANITSINTNNSGRAITFRDNAGGEYWNSIFQGYSKAIDIEDLNSGEDSEARFQAGDLKLNNNIHWNMASNDAANQIITSGDITGTDLLGGTSGNQVIDPMLNNGVIGIGDAAVWPAGLPAFFQQVNYKGAFDPAAGSRWIDGWTATDVFSVIQ